MPDLPGLVLCTLAAVAVIPPLHAQTAPPATLATLDDVQGRVFIAHGDDYIAATAAMPLTVGDRLITLEDASATLRYPNDCTLTVPAASQFTLWAVYECRLDIKAMLEAAPTEPPDWHSNR